MCRAKVLGVVLVLCFALAVSFAFGAKPSPGEKLPWGVTRVEANKVWDQNGDMAIDTGAVTGNPIKIAILDTGIDVDHPDLPTIPTGSTGRGINTVGAGTDFNFNDTGGHGTMIAGIIAAIDNSTGYIGVAPGVELYIVRFRNTSGAISPDAGANLSDPSTYKFMDLYEGLDWCISKGVDIITMSFGIWQLSSPNNEHVAPLHDPEFYKRLKAASDIGIILVAAAGNGVTITNSKGRPIEEFDSPTETGSPFVPAGDPLQYDFPASYPNVIAVSATGVRYTKGKPGTQTRIDYLADFSNYGPKVELAAPGVSIESTWIGGGYGIGGGTSYASPHATAVIALALASGRFTQSDIRGRLSEIVEDIGVSGRDDTYGYGLVNARIAVGINPAPPYHRTLPVDKLSVTWGKLKI